MTTAEDTVLVLDAATLGRDDNELGSLLIGRFLRAVAFRDEVPGTIVAYNGGVKLAEAGSATVPALETLAQKGADIVLCGTCVNFFRIADRVAVGRVGDMQGIVDAISKARKVIYV